MDQTKKKTNRDTLTAEDLKGNIFKSLQESGVYDELKSHLRQSMVNELMAKNKIAGTTVKHEKANLLSATIHPKAGVSWTQRALDNLVLHHIKRSKYHYTMSLFQQESGLKKYSKTLTIELLTKLGLQPNSLANKSCSSSTDSSVISYTSYTPESSWMMWDIMEALSSHQRSEVCKKTIESSTPIKKNMTLADKLLAVDHEFTKHTENMGRESRGSMMTTLNTAIQQAEKEAERRYKMNLEQWKMYELTKVRTEEAEKAKRMMNQRVEQIEKDYAEQKKALENRERMAVERLTNHRKSLEAELHIQRQKLLQEMEGLKSREELIEQQEKHMRKMEAMRMREIDMLKAATIKGLQSDGNQPIELQFQSNMNDVLMAQLDSMFKENNKLKSELSKLKEGTASQQQEEQEVDVATNKHHLISSSTNNKVSVDDDFFAAQNERLRIRIEELENAILEMKNERDQQYQHNLEGNLRQEVDDLKKMKNEQDSRQRHLEEMIRKMRDTIDQNTEAMKGSPPTSKQQHKYSPHTTPLHKHKSITFQHPTDEDQYEQVCRDVLFGDQCAPPKLYASNNGERPLFKTCCTKERVKLLGEQSDALQRELEKYNERDFQRKLTETKRQIFSTTDGYDGRQDSLKDDWSKKSPDINSKKDYIPQEFTAVKSVLMNDVETVKQHPTLMNHYDGDGQMKLSTIEQAASPRELERRSRSCSRSSSIKSDQLAASLELMKDDQVDEMNNLLLKQQQHDSLLPPAGNDKAESVKEEISERKDNEQHSYHSLKSQSEINSNEQVNDDDSSFQLSLSSAESSVSTSKQSNLHSIMISEDKENLISSTSSDGRPQSQPPPPATKSSVSSIDEISLQLDLSTKPSSDENSSTRLNVRDLETRTKSPMIVAGDGDAEVDVKEEKETDEQRVTNTEDAKDNTKTTNTEDAKDNTKTTNTEDVSSSESFTSCPDSSHNDNEEEGGDVFEQSSTKSLISIESRNDGYKEEDDSW